MDWAHQGRFTSSGGCLTRLVKLFRSACHLSVPIFQFLLLCISFCLDVFEKGKMEILRFVSVELIETKLPKVSITRHNQCPKVDLVWFDIWQHIRVSANHLCRETGTYQLDGHGRYKFCATKEDLETSPRDL